MKNYSLIQMGNEADIVREAIRSLRDFAQSCEEQRTRRYEISQKCKLASKIIDANTEALKLAIDSSREERLRIMDDLDRIFMMSAIDDHVVKLAERLFDYLERTSAVAALRSAPPMPMLL